MDASKVIEHLEHVISCRDARLAWEAQASRRELEAVREDRDRNREALLSIADLLGVTLPARDPGAALSVVSCERILAAVVSRMVPAAPGGRIVR